MLTIVIGKICSHKGQYLQQCCARGITVPVPAGRVASISKENKKTLYIIGFLYLVDKSACVLLYESLFSFKREIVSEADYFGGRA